MWKVAGVQRIWRTTTFFTGKWFEESLEIITKTQKNLFSYILLSTLLSLCLDFLPRLL